MSGEGRARLPHHAVRAGVGVLDVEDRIVLALLDHLGEVEIERRVVLAHQHDEAHRVGADLVDDFTQRDEVAGTLRHLYRLARAHQPHELAEPTSSAALPPDSADTAACMRLT